MRSESKVALVHSPEIVDLVAENNYSLYLTGHTHGGQICLPGGIPIVTHKVPRKFNSGVWQHKHLQGYTNKGSGVCGLSVRYNCLGEVAFITLRRKKGAIH